jgi:hypothetical protein
MTATEEKLDRYHQLTCDMRSLETGLLEKCRALLSPEDFDRVAKADKELKAYYDDLSIEREKIKAEITKIVLREKKTFAGRYVQAVFSRPSLKWDRKLLEFEIEKDKQFARRIKRFFKLGEPSVSIRSVGNGNTD